MTPEKLASIQSNLKLGLTSYGTATRLSDHYQDKSEADSRLKNTINTIKLKNTIRKIKRRRQIMATIKAPKPISPYAGVRPIRTSF